MILLILAVTAILMNNLSDWCLGLNCADIAEAGSGSKFPDVELQTLATVSPSQLQPCIVLLGKDYLQPAQAKTLWTVIVKIYGSASEIPENDLRLLGWIISGIPSSDFKNLTLVDVDTIAAFGQYRNLSRNQLAALYDSVTNVWSNKGEEDLSSYDLKILKQIICAFNASLILNIHPDAYRDAASELATLQDCPRDVIEALAKLATDEDAFGNPSEWTSNKVASVGCILSGLSEIQVNVIPVEAMRGLTVDMVKCLPSTTLQSMTKEQLSIVNSNTAIKPELYQNSQKVAHIIDGGNEQNSRVNSAKNIPKNMATTVSMSAFCQLLLIYLLEDIVFAVNCLLS